MIKPVNGSTPAGGANGPKGTANPKLEDLKRRVTTAQDGVGVIALNDALKTVAEATGNTSGAMSHRTTSKAFTHEGPRAKKAFAEMEPFLRQVPAKGA